MTPFLINLTLLIITIFFVVKIYLKCSELKNKCNKTFFSVDAYLKRYWKLIPEFEKISKANEIEMSKLFCEVIRLENKYDYDVLTNDEKNRIALKVIKAISETFLQIKDNCEDEEFKANITKFLDLEEEFYKAQRAYNNNVKEYNAYVEKMPYCLIASFCKFNPMQSFAVEK